MRYLFAAFVLSLGLSTFSAHAAYPLLPERIFAPVGFDANDDAQVVLFGHFPSTCHQAGSAEVSVRGHDIVIRNSALKLDAGPCLQALVPWTTTVSLGRLGAGEYRIFAASPEMKSVMFAKLTVLPAFTPRTDDYLYAYVNGASMSHTERGPVLTLSGTYSLTCMYIERVIVAEKDGVIVVRPIVALRKDIPCGYPFVPIPYNRKILLQPKTEAALLIHIRSMNGQALNQVLE